MSSVNKNFSFKVSLFLVLSIAIISGCAHYQPTNYVTVTNQNIPLGVLHARFYGTSTLILSDGYKSLLVDGFFTRQGFGRSILDRMESDDEALDIIKNRKVDVVLVAHSHFDHARDVERITNLKKPILFGSARTLAIVDSPDQRLFSSTDAFPLGEFVLTFIKSEHVEKSLPTKIFEQLFLIAAGGTKFLDKGDVYSFFVEHPQANVLIIPSAKFPAKWAIKNRKNADFVFLSVGLLGEQTPEYMKEYWQAAVVDTCAKYVIPIHWDDFRIPLSKKLKATSDAFNDVTAAMKELSTLAKYPICNGHEVEIIFAERASPFLLTKEGINL